MIHFLPSIETFICYFVSIPVGISVCDFLGYLLICETALGQYYSVLDNSLPDNSVLGQFGTRKFGQLILLLKIKTQTHNVYSLFNYQWQKKKRIYNA